MTSEQAITVFRRVADAVQRVDPVIIEELELAAFVYVQRALKTFTPDQADGFVPHLKLLYGWMQHQQDLALKGCLRVPEFGCRLAEQRPRLREATLAASGRANS